MALRDPQQACPFSGIAVKMLLQESVNKLPQRLQFPMACQSKRAEFDIAAMDMTGSHLPEGTHLSKGWQRAHEKIRVYFQYLPRIPMRQENLSAK